MVAIALDMAPRTVRENEASAISRNSVGTSLTLTKRLPQLQARLAREQDGPQPLVRPVRDGGIDHEHQARFQAPPETRDAVLAVDDLAAGREKALPLPLALRLLTRRDDGDGNGEHLRDGAGDGAEGKLDERRRRRIVLRRLLVQRPDDGIPVKVGKVGRGHADERGVHAGVQALEAILLENLGNRVHCRGVVRVRGGVRGFRWLGLDLDL